MVDKLRIGVIFGGRSGEHEVSLMSAHSVLAVLDPQRYTVTCIGITHAGAWLVGENVLQALQQNLVSSLTPAALLPEPNRPGLYTLDPTPGGELLHLLTALDVVFPLLHGTFGEDGTLQGLLELADVAYIGAGVLGSSVGMDKALFKDVMRTHHIPVAESQVFSRRQVETQMDQVISQAEGIAPYPLFVKPANLGSSVGISRCRTRSDLLEGLLDAARYDRRILVERGIDAREIEISVLGNEEAQVSLPGEVIPSDEFYSYAAKYLDDRSRLIIPAPLSPGLTAQIQDLAVRAYRAIDCAGMARRRFPARPGYQRTFPGRTEHHPGFYPYQHVP